MLGSGTRLHVLIIHKPRVNHLRRRKCLYYDQKRSRKAATLMAGSLILVMGALEVAMVFAIRPSMNKRAITFFGVFASILIAIGLLPQYMEIIKRKEVVGISLIFLTIDILGGLFSDLSLVFRNHFDIVAAILYTLVIVSLGLFFPLVSLMHTVHQVMDSVVLVAAVILNPRAEKRRREGRGIMLTETLTETTENTIQILNSVPVTYNTPSNL